MNGNIGWHATTVGSEAALDHVFDLLPVWSFACAPSVYWGAHPGSMASSHSPEICLKVWVNSNFTSSMTVFCVCLCVCACRCRKSEILSSYSSTTKLYRKNNFRDASKTIHLAAT